MKQFSTKHILLLLLIFYFILHLIHLTLLPIFNDEAIYLDWGWTYTHLPGHLYDSLQDAKQPFMIWLFGIFEHFFTNPLVAGRFVSVLFGGLSAWGIYRLTEKLFTKHVAFFVTIIYIVTPIFVFYNRQALFESAVAALGIWSGIFLLRIIDKPSVKQGILFGIILGLGFFIKTTFILFIISACIILLYLAFRKRSGILLKTLGLSILSLLAVNILLLINPDFWQTLSSNTRYSLSVSDLFHFPLFTWWNSLTGFFVVGFIFMSPLIFVCSITGLVLLYKKKNTQQKILFGYFLLALVFEIFSVRNQSQRYLVPFLPFLIIPAGYLLSLFWQQGTIKKIIVIISLLIPLGLTLLLLFNPFQYMYQLHKVSSYSETSYIYGQTSGYGVNQVMQYIEEHSLASTPTMMLFGTNAGNPENAIDIYSQNMKNIYGLHFDSSFFTDLNHIDCFTSTYPVYLVTREDQTLGMGQYFNLIKKFYTPDGNYFIGLYTLKGNCKGKSESLSTMYKPSIEELLQLRYGE